MNQTNKTIIATNPLIYKKIIHKPKFFLGDKCIQWQERVINLHEYIKYFHKKCITFNSNNKSIPQLQHMLS